LISISPATLEKYRATGEGTVYVKISRKLVRYRRGHVMSWIEERLQHNTSAAGISDVEVIH
jgi:hypothetical protein